MRNLGMNIKTDMVMKNIAQYMRALSRLSGIMLLLLLINSGRLLSQCETINLACNDLINVSINEDCYASINADLILEDPPFGLFPDNGMNYDILLQDEAGFPLIPSNQVGEDQVGMTIKATVTLVPCNISCWGYIYVEDKIGPKFWDCLNGSLPDVEIDCDDYSDGYVIPDPLLGSVCETIDDLSFEDDTSAVSCTDEFALSIFRVWTAKDLSGNFTQCNQTINIRKYDLKDVVIPSDFIVEIDPDADCNESQDTSPERTGYPTGIYCPNIKYYYTDINYPQCGLQKKILRDWFVIDWCTGQSITSGQIIKIIDAAPPRVICELDTLIAPKAPYACVAAPLLNPLRIPGFDTLASVTVLDTCAEDIFVEVGFLPAQENEDQPIDAPYYLIQADSNGLFQLPEFENSAWVRYCFSDACGNKTQIPEDPSDADSLGFCCYFQIDAKDEESPTAVCEGFTKVPLAAGGLTQVPAESFDDNSFDPCDGISHFEVRREADSCPGFMENGNQGWSDSVHFCCEDLGDTITIRLRVFDTAGNFRECLGLVCVTDPVTPSVVCPMPVVELDCGDDFRDYDLIGLPTGEDGCDAGLKLGEELFDLKDYDLDCGIGLIVRTIEVKDAEHNLIKLCEQEIIYDPDVSTKLEPGDFDFPDDITLDICDSGGSIDPVFTGLPETEKEFGCANIAITFNDSNPHIQNVNGVCYTIFREWQVVDWCNYHPSSPNQHILKATQEIRVVNTAVADFNCPQDIIVSATGIECEAFVDLKVNISSSCPTSFDVTWRIDAFSDGGIDFEGNGDDASGIYPVGEHTISYSASNICGGVVSSCTFRFTVEGDKAPTPICLAELTWSVGQGTTEIWASDFDQKSEAGCGLDDLIFSFVDPTDASFPQTGKIYDCSDIPNGVAADIEVDIYVVDEEGRFASCRSTLKLQDPSDVCTDSSNGATASGEIITEMSVPLEQVMVELNDMSNEDYMMEMTGLSGVYTFEGLNSYHNYSIQPVHDKDPLNGVSTLDLLLIQRHILGMDPIDNPFKLIAADIDNSGSISAVDLIQLRKLILGIFDKFPENDSWTFVPEAHSFADPLHPWQYSRYIELYEMGDLQDQLDFVAIKVGDINTSAASDANNKGNTNKEASVYLSTLEKSFKRGELVEVPVILENDIAGFGMQFTIEFDDQSLLFQGIDGYMLDVQQDNFALLNKKAGKISFSFNSIELKDYKASDVLFKIYFEATGDGQLSEKCQLNSSVTAAEFYDEKMDVLDIDFLIRSDEDKDAATLELFQNIPNPFSNITTISFSNPKRQNVRLSILDPNGRLLLKRESEFDKGVNKFIIYSDDLDSSGLLLYRIESSGASITRKMIMVK
jgi:hypothetical protein